MKLIVATLAVIAAAMPAALAQGQKELCAKLATPMTGLGPAARAFLEAVQSGDLANTIYQFDGEQRDALNKLQDARRDLIPALEAYATAMEDAGYSMQKCAR